MTKVSGNYKCIDLRRDGRLLTHESFRKKKVKLCLWPKMARVGPPLSLDLKIFPKKLLWVTLGPLTKSQEMRHINFFLGGASLFRPDGQEGIHPAFLERGR